MKVCYSSANLQIELDAFRKQNMSIGFVPTMGALHQGHISLLKKSIKENQVSIVSIFVNPRQFNQKKDLEKYPRMPEKDLIFLDENACDIVFMPDYKEVFSDESNINVDLKGLDTVLEGACRPGHFQGVVDVVYQLFKLVNPNRAYFGKKDFQQLLVIKQMVKSKSLKIEIRACSIIRETDGLAMSSRNHRLSPENRKFAVEISKALFVANKNAKKHNAQSIIELIRNLLQKNKALEIEYVALHNPNTFVECKSNELAENNILLVAVWCGGVRLIDNIVLGA